MMVVSSSFYTVLLILVPADGICRVNQKWPICTSAWVEAICTEQIPASPEQIPLSDCGFSELCAMSPKCLLNLLIPQTVATGLPVCPDN